MSKDIATLTNLVKYLKFSPTFLIYYNHKEREFQVEKFYWVYLLRCTITILATLSCTIWNALEYGAFKDLNTRVTMFRSFLVVMCLTLSYRNRKSLAECINKILDIDRYLEQNGITMTYKPLRNIVIIRITVTISIIVGNSILYWFHTKSLRMCFINCGIYNISYLTNSLILIQNGAIVFSVWERLKALNLALIKLIVITNNPKKCYERLRKISILYGKIYQLTRAINTIYSQQVSLTLWLAFLHTFQCILSSLRNSNDLSYYDIFWVVISVLDILSIVIPSSSAAQLVKLFV